MKYKITYEGDLRTRAVHDGSGEEIITDAPVDNQGNGRYFSPTDMTSVSLATCMMTIIGITTKNLGIELKEMSADVEKIMASSPRRIKMIKIQIELSIHPNRVDEQEKLINAARKCPVALSLHPDIDQDVYFQFS